MSPEATTTALLDAALDYAARDGAVFPLIGKIPFAGGHDCSSGYPHQHGHRDATTSDFEPVDRMREDEAHGYAARRRAERQARTQRRRP